MNLHYGQNCLVILEAGSFERGIAADPLQGWEPVDA